MHPHPGTTTKARAAAGSASRFPSNWDSLRTRASATADTSHAEQIDGGADPQAIELAEDIVATQQAEIDEMNALLSDL